jgi:hypothetical protein
VDIALWAAASASNHEDGVACDAPFSPDAFGIIHYSLNYQTRTSLARHPLGHCILDPSHLGWVLGRRRTDSAPVADSTEKDAFGHCVSLERIYILAWVIALDDEGLCDCRALRVVSFSGVAGLRCIGSFAFGAVWA